MQENLWKVILRASRGVNFFSIMEGVPSDSFYCFYGSCCNIQFKPYVIPKMELFVTKNRSWLETVDSCYIEVRLKCDRAPHGWNPNPKFFPKKGRVGKIVGVLKNWGTTFNILTKHLTKKWEVGNIGVGSS